MVTFINICTSANGFLQSLPQKKYTKGDFSEIQKHVLRKQREKRYLRHGIWIIPDLQALRAKDYVSFIFVLYLQNLSQHVTQSGCSVNVEWKRGWHEKCSFLIKHPSMLTSASLWSRSYQDTNKAVFSIFWSSPLPVETNSYISNILFVIFKRKFQTWPDEYVLNKGKW